ncbi:MAG: M2 family metallopeptidase [Planctomycetaceae bacterium]|nr:M2 family metallopeptidase [Planctomycetaceae bacterium]
MRSESEESKMQFKAFLDEHLAVMQKMVTEANLAEWQAAVTGKQEDFDDASVKSLAVRTYLSDPAKYQKFQDLRKNAGGLTNIENRCADMVEISFRSNQIPSGLLKQMVDLSTEIEMIFQNYRAKLDGKEYNNNELLETLSKETDSAKREAAWAALKQVGDQVGGKLIALAKVRNQAAAELGFKNYWEMEIVFQEHNPEQLMQIFEELDQLTAPIFAEMKTEMDAEQAERFGIKPEEIMPWHYDNPFFQEPPKSAAIDFDRFYAGKTPQDIAEIGRKFYQDIGIPVDSILEKSDLYDRPGKNQHGFCTSIDNSGDVRILVNLKPTIQWMDTQLHELGHAVYDLHVDRNLPYNLREAAHIFTTEGVAMYFGALPYSPDWMVKYLGVEPEKADAAAKLLKKQRRREQLIFCRWVLVMLHFEKALYENPDQNLNTLWWDMAEKYQLLKRPQNRNAADWASKPHFTIAPVYYHNYMLGELYAAMIRKITVNVPQGTDEYRDFFMNSVFKAGHLLPWPDFVVESTGQPLSPAAFAEELQGIDP